MNKIRRFCFPRSILAERLLSPNRGLNKPKLIKAIASFIAAAVHAYPAKRLESPRKLDAEAFFPAILRQHDQSADALILDAPEPKLKPDAVPHALIELYQILAAKRKHPIGGHPQIDAAGASPQFESRLGFTFHPKRKRQSNNPAGSADAPIQMRPPIFFVVHNLKRFASIEGYRVCNSDRIGTIRIKH